ncbi:MAG: hypothetical protein IPL61_30305 [Myxococcales bacterium]|nr:hypothetical protein [Myxococcales bacterium]
MRSLLVVLVLLTASSTARAERWFVDVEPVAIHGSADDHTLASMLVVSAGRRLDVGGVTPFVALGGGLLNVSARAGVLVPVRGAWVARIEVRPQLALVCVEPAVLAGAGAGYRFAGDGTPITVIAAAEGGPGWARMDCHPDRPLGPTERTWFAGGTLSVAIGL